MVSRHVLSQRRLVVNILEVLTIVIGGLGGIIFVLAGICASWAEIN